VLDARTLLVGLAVISAIGLSILAFFIVERGWMAVSFAAAGIALLFLYDAAPVPLKSVGLGEPAVFLVWGPLMIGGGYAMIAGEISPAAFWASVPYGLGVMAILVGKHIDQMDFDRGKGIRTLPVLLGEADGAGAQRRDRRPDLRRHGGVDRPRPAHAFRRGDRRRVPARLARDEAHEPPASAGGSRGLRRLALWYHRAAWCTTGCSAGRTSRGSRAARPGRICGSRTVKLALGAWLLVLASSARRRAGGAQRELLGPARASLTAGMLVPFCADMESVTGARVKCNILPKAPVGAAQTLDGIKDGLMDLSFITHGYTPGRFALTEAAEFPLHGRYRRDHFRRVPAHPRARAGENEGTRDLVLLSVFTHGPDRSTTRAGPSGRSRIWRD